MFNSKSQRLFASGFLAMAGSLMVAASAQAQVYEFTNCGAEGRLGPSQGDCDTEYSGTTLDGEVTLSDGIQSWTVPATGPYIIQAVGAAGGTQLYDGDEGSPGIDPGGLGASLTGTFELTAGETISIVVGQMGGDTRADVDTGDDWESAAPGGGGGSFVFRNANDALPLMAAGGGGSGSNCTFFDASLQNASLTTDGHTAQNVDQGNIINGGSDGNGGLNNGNEASYWAGGGAGWLTDGSGGQNLTDFDFEGEEDNDGDGGLAVRNGSLGGQRGDDGDDENTDEGGDGGFGGGGGGGSDNMGGGGGGGFSGGGGADGERCGNSDDDDSSDDVPSNNPGGGGGSYNGGTAPSAALASTQAHGQVTIRFAGAVEPPQEAMPVPVDSPYALLLLLIGLLGSATWAVRRLA